MAMPKNTFNGTLVQKKGCKQVFSKTVEGCIGMAVPKTTETRCRDGSVQATHVIHRPHN